MASPTSLQQQGLALQALSVALQHPALAANQRNICTLLEVSKAWRAATQQSAAAITNCSFELQLSQDELSRFTTFTGWLAKHAGLVSTLDICYKDWCMPLDAGALALLAAMQQLAEFALRVAAAASTSGQSAPLRLQSLSSFLPASPELLAAMPAATLTCLELRVDKGSCFAPLGDLLNIRTLRLEFLPHAAGINHSSLHQLSKLKQLTQLQLYNMPVSTDTSLLPVQLQQLILMYEPWYYRASNAAVQVNLQHLTSLQHLQLNAGVTAPGSSVPQNLQSLDVKAQWPEGEMLGIPGLQQVTSVKLSTSSISRAELEALQHLPQLRDLSLRLQHPEIQSLEAAAGFSSIPLCSLHVYAEIMSVNELQQLVPHVAAATGLTKLKIKVNELAQDDEDDEGMLVELCEHLKALRQLRDLKLNIGIPGDFEPQDTQHLSALVTLTSLELSSDGYGPFVDEATLCLLAVALTGLKSLSVNVRCEDYARGVEQDFRGMLALPAVLKLTDLAVLQVGGMSAEDAQRGLQFLTGLSNLTKLEGFEAAGEAALQDFWANIRQQQSGR